MGVGDFFVVEVVGRVLLLLLLEDYHLHHRDRGCARLRKLLRRPLGRLVSLLG